MALQEMVDVFRGLATSILGSSLNNQSGKMNYVRNILYGIVFISAVSGIYYGYSWYVAYRERSAQRAFSGCVMYYQKAMTSGIQEDWQFVDASFKTAYETHRHSLLAPYFLVFRAHALDEMGMLAEAITLMDTAVAHMSKNSPLFSYAALRRALMKIDSDDAVIRDQGVTELERLSYDQANTNRDAALSSLSSYYTSINNTEKAEQAYKTLVDLGWQNAVIPSPWYQDALASLEGK